MRGNVVIVFIIYLTFMNFTDAIIRTKYFKAGSGSGSTASLGHFILKKVPVRSRLECHLLCLQAEDCRTAITDQSGSSMRCIITWRPVMLLPKSPHSTMRGVDPGPVNSCVFGPWPPGYDASQAFDDVAMTTYGPIFGLEIWTIDTSPFCIHAFRVRFNKTWGPYHGNWGNRPPSKWKKTTISIAAGEYIKEVTVGTGRMYGTSLFMEIQLKTNRQSFPMIGAGATKYHNSQGVELSYFNGSKAYAIDRIQLHYVACKV